MLKPLLTSALLVSSLLSCAAVTPTEPTIQDIPEEIPVKTQEDFIQEKSMPLEVVPPPEGITLEVIPPPLEQEEVAAVNYPFLVMRPTGKTNNFGNPIFEVAMFANGKLQHRVLTVSGRAHTQTRSRNVAGNEAPLPNGKYRVSTNVIPGTHPEVGGRFLPITPMFSTNRSALGFHVDPSFNRDPKEDGTSGCIGTTTVAERDLLFDFVRRYKPQYLQVNI